jgi:hypothetical protein
MWRNAHRIAPRFWDSRAISCYIQLTHWRHRFKNGFSQTVPAGQPTLRSQFQEWLSKMIISSSMSQAMTPFYDSSQTQNLAGGFLSVSPVAGTDWDF